MDPVVPEYFLWKWLAVLAGIDDSRHFAITGQEIAEVGILSANDLDNPRT